MPDDDVSGLDDPVAEPDSDATAYWNVWAGPIGRTVMPALEELRTNVVGLTSAMVFTPSGVPLCWVGLEEPDANRVSAAAISAYARSGAAASRASQLPDDPSLLDSAYLAYGGSHALIVAVKDLIVGPLLLWVAADEVNLGVLTFQSKGTADRIRHALANEDASSS